MLDYYHFKEIHDLFAKGRHEAARHLLSEMQARYIAVCDENAMLKSQIHEMEDVLFLAKNLFFDGSCYWLTTGGFKQGPFCRRCYDRDGVLFHLEKIDGEWLCPTCETVHERIPPVKPHTEIVQRAPIAAKVIPFSR